MIQMKKKKFKKMFTEKRKKLNLVGLKEKN
jgi:hypothetical protein